MCRTVSSAASELGSKMVARCSVSVPKTGRIEHNLAKVGVEGSSPFARSNNLLCLQEFLQKATGPCPVAFCFGVHLGSTCADVSGSENQAQGHASNPFHSSLSDFKIVDDRLQSVGHDFEACKRDR